MAVAIARAFFHLPYFRAEMQCQSDAAGTVRYTSQRTHGDTPVARLEGHYAPTGAVYHATPGTLEAWLIERYCLYSVDRCGQIYRGEIHHQPWPLQPAVADFSVNWVAQADGVALPDTPPLLHFARTLHVAAWAIEAVTAAL